MDTHDVADEASQQLDAAISAARSAKASVDSVADDLMAAFNRSVREQPLTTLAIAVSVGLVLGAVLKK